MGESVEGNLDGYLAFIFIAAVLSVYAFIQFCIAIDRAIRRKKEKISVQKQDESGYIDKKGIVFLFVGVATLPGSFLLFLENYGLLSGKNYPVDCRMVIVISGFVMFLIGLILLPIGYDRVRESKVLNAVSKFLVSIIVFNKRKIVLKRTTSPKFFIFEICFYRDYNPYGIGYRLSGFSIRR